MKKTIHKALWAFLALIFFFISFSSICGGAFGAPASAATPVLEDLQRDDSFNIDDYPEKLNDYSLNVIQIAESSDDELFIYVYQPSGQGTGIYASSINISHEKDNTENLSFNNYKLEYLRSSGVFFKYKVKGFELEKSDIRYYNISNILRPFNTMYDTPPENGNKVSEVKNRVGQLWTVFAADNGEISYEMTGSEVIEITQKYVGCVEYHGGFKQGAYYTYGKNTYRHFVAFSTDRDIDRLIEVELQYSLCEMTYSICSNTLCPYHSYLSTYKKSKSEPGEPIIKTLYADRKSESLKFGWGGHKYTWYDIQSTDEFIKDNNNANYELTTEGAKDIDGTQWVLNYFNAEHSGKSDPNIWDAHIHFTGETVSDVMILRLMFETDGVTYNLGVVDNKQTGDGKNDNRFKGNGNTFNFFEWLSKELRIPTWSTKLLSGLIMGVLLILALCLLFPAFGKVLCSIITAPFKRKQETQPHTSTRSKSTKTRSKRK